MNNQESPQSDLLIIDKRHLSWLIAGILALLGGAFLCGYFWGRSTIVTQWLVDAEHQAFSDHIYTALHEQYDEQETDDSDEADTLDQEEETEELGEPTETTDKKEPRYHAQLIGYKASKKAEAEQFIKKLKELGIVASLREYTSRSKRGKTILWYQVVTDSYTNPDELKRSIALIQQHFKLHDIRIIQE